MISCRTAKMFSSLTSILPAVIEFLVIDFPGTLILIYMRNDDFSQQGIGGCTLIYPRRVFSVFI